MKKDLEIRSISVEFQADNENRIISGLAIPLEQKSELLGGEFYEIISRNAISEDFLKKQDIKIYLDHNPKNGTFARCKKGEGSLDLNITDRGLEFSFEAPNTVFGNALLEGIRRKDYDAVSFGFIVGKDEWVKNEDKTYLRTVNSIKLIDEIFILSQAPAYEQTNVNIRSLEAYKEEEEKILQEEIRKNEIFNKLDSIVNDIDTKYEKYLIK